MLSHAVEYPSHLNHISRFQLCLDYITYTFQWLLLEYFDFHFLPHSPGPRFFFSFLIFYLVDTDFYAASMVWRTKGITNHVAVLIIHHDSHSPFASPLFLLFFLLSPPPPATSFSFSLFLSPLSWDLVASFLHSYLVIVVEVLLTHLHLRLTRLARIFIPLRNTLAGIFNNL